MTAGNLLFLYGPSGTGKTTLLQIIEESCVESSVLRVGCQQLADDMARYFIDRNFRGFYDKYVPVKTLLLDNLWLLRRRRSLAEETRHLIRARMEQGNLTILASDLSYEEVIATLPAIGECLEKYEAIRLHLGPRRPAPVLPSLEELTRYSLEDDR